MITAMLSRPSHSRSLGPFPSLKNTCEVFSGFGRRKALRIVNEAVGVCKHGAMCSPGNTTRTGGE